jgi:hypothetical protein
MMSLMLATSRPEMTTARILYRDCLIDLVSDVQGWRVAAITHSTDGKVRPPDHHHLDLATAQRYAEAAVDAQLAGREKR